MMVCLFVGLGCQRHGEKEEQLNSESGLVKQHVPQSQPVLTEFKLHLSPQNLAFFFFCLGLPPLWPEYPAAGHEEI